MNSKKWEIKADVELLVKELVDFLDGKDYVVQTIQEPDRITIQARKTSTIRDWTGFSFALTVRISSGSSWTRVEMGRQRWLDKAAIGVAGTFLAPLLAVAGAGAYLQYKITQDTWNVIENHMARRSGGVTTFL